MSWKAILLIFIAISTVVGDVNLALMYYQKYYKRRDKKRNDRPDPEQDDSAT